MRSVSFGKTWLAGDVTPWLHALRLEAGLQHAARSRRPRSPRPRPPATTSPATRRSGSRWPHLDACPWGGAYFPPGIWLNGRHDRHVIAHELGHTYGVSEEGSAWICDPSCHAQPYLNPFSVMGHGWSDFGAWEKREFGWLDRIAEPAPRLTLGAIDRPSASPQALRVLAAGDEYWFEYRPPAPVWAYESDDAAPGVAIHAGSNGLGEPSRYSGRNFLLYDPVGARAALGAGR